MSRKPVASLFTLLTDVEKRPGAWLCDLEDHGGMLDRLPSLIHGYLHAVALHQAHDPGAELFKKFPDYLMRRFGWNMCLGVIATIRVNHQPDSEAWEAFWRLLREFRDEH